MIYVLNTWWKMSKSFLVAKIKIHTMIHKRNTSKCSLSDNLCYFFQNAVLTDHQYTIKEAQKLSHKCLFIIEKSWIKANLNFFSISDIMGKNCFKLKPWTWKIVPLLFCKVNVLILFFFLKLFNHKVWHYHINKADTILKN